jgi:hypothetical protein
VNDTWAGRDLPVLDAVVTALEDEFRVSAAEIAAVTGIPGDEVVKAFYALRGTYTGELTVHMGPGAGRFFVDSVTEEARRAVGQWPTGETLVERLADGIAQAAERETDPERKSKLTAVARGLGGVARDVVVSVASQVLGQHVPH